MEFKSAITRGGNAILPEFINVTDSEVAWKRRNKTLISSDSISIPIQAISSVEIDTSLIGTTIRIKSKGKGEILATDFTASDAKAIKRLINQYQTDLAKSNKREKYYENITSNPELEIKQFEEDKYYDLDRIPLIHFSNNADEVISELNKLIALAKNSIDKKENKKTQAYQNKISEGLRILAVSNLTQSQEKLENNIQNDLHNLIIQSNLFQGLKISYNNSEKLRVFFYFVMRNKWWTLFILSLIYVTIRNLIEK